jgi:rubrerythrin
MTMWSLLLVLVLAVCVVPTVHAARGQRMCPCVNCIASPIVDSRTWADHAGQIARGERARATDAQPCAVAAQVQPALDDQIESDSEEEDCTGIFYAMEMAELVATGKVNVTGMQDVLKATSARYQPHLPEGVNIPKSWYKARKIAVDGREPKFFTLDFCPECDHLFEEDADDDHCPDCDKDSRYTQKGNKQKAVRQAYYFDLDDKCTRLLAAKLQAGMVLPPTTTPVSQDKLNERELNCAFDGSIMEELYHGADARYKDNTFYFTWSNDGVEIQKNISYTPIVAKLLNLPKEQRGALACIWLLGY